MAPLRVLQVHNHYRERGGEDTVVAREASLLRANGHEVVQHQVGNPEAATAAAASFAAAPWNPRSARTIRHIAGDLQPDVAHVHNTWWSLSPSVLRALDRQGIPVVMTLHNYRLLCANAQLFRDGGPCEDCVGTHAWRGVVHRCYRNSFAASTVAAAGIQLNRWMGTWKAVDRLLPLTEFARDRFVAAGLPGEKLRIKPNFVDDPGVRGQSPSTSNSVLFVGRLSLEKGVGPLLAAWRRAALDDLELVIVGDGPLRSSLQADIPGVRFVGSQPGEEVRRLMLSSRALVFPSIWYEGQPMVLLEALAAGLPMVVSDIGGVPETVAGASTSVLALPGDAASWAKALGRLVHASWVDEAGSGARSVYEARYSPEAGLAGLLDTYAEAIEARRRGRIQS